MLNIQSRLWFFFLKYHSPPYILHKYLIFATYFQQEHEYSLCICCGNRHQHNIRPVSCQISQDEPYVVDTDSCLHSADHTFTNMAQHT